MKSSSMKTTTTLTLSAKVEARKVGELTKYFVSIFNNNRLVCQVSRNSKKVKTAIWCQIDLTLYPRVNPRNHISNDPLRLYDDCERVNTDWVMVNLETNDVIAYRLKKDTVICDTEALSSPLSKKARHLLRTFFNTTDITEEQKDWIVAQGGIERLDGRKIQLPNGKLLCFLRQSWSTTVENIELVASGGAFLV